MNIKIEKLFVLLAATLFVAACGGDDDGTGTEPADSPAEDPASSTRVDRAFLEAAVPANGDVVEGRFLLGAIVDYDQPVEVRFLLDGVEVGAVNELPYQIQMDACDLTVGNHAYIVQIEDADGNKDYTDQFFETKACD